MSSQSGSSTSRQSNGDLFAVVDGLALLDPLRDAELVAHVLERERAMRRLHTENALFEEFLRANDPATVERMSRALHAATEVWRERQRQHQLQLQEQHQDAATAGTLSLASAAGTRRRSTSMWERESLSIGSYSIPTGSVSTVAMDGGGGPRINATTKIDLVMRTIDDIGTELRRFRAASKRTRDVLCAEVEENTVRRKELEESLAKFETEIVVGAVEALTQRIPAEKFVRYMTEWQTAAQIQLEKLRLRTSSSCTQRRCLQTVLARKRELSTAVDAIDFEKLDVQNKNFLADLAEKSRNLFELKQVTGTANLLVMRHRKFLHQQDEKMARVLLELERTRRKTADLSREHEETRNEVDREAAKHERTKWLVEKHSVPSVMEYVTVKKELTDLRRRLKTWKRKLRIQKVATDTYERIMCGLTGSSRPKPEWREKKIIIWDNGGLLEHIGDHIDEFFVRMRKRYSSPEFEFPEIPE